MKLRTIVAVAVMALVGAVASAESRYRDTNIGGRYQSVIYNDENTSNKTADKTWLANMAMTFAEGTSEYDAELVSAAWWDDSDIRNILTDAEQLYVQMFKDAYCAFNLIIGDENYMRWEFVCGNVYRYTSDSNIRYNGWRVYTIKYTPKYDH